ncbi:MAG: F0F1 ATP synthase subunit alpha [Clostridia bacterium]|nr:F0F1 ATP synthase subunit alpha [Clostridia bacterium]
MPHNSEESIGSYLKKQILSFEVEPVSYSYGQVSKTGDGVVRVAGLSGRKYGELLEFEDGIFGMALDLEEDGVGAVLLDISDSVGVGDKVCGTDRVVEVPVGDALLGRVVDPIGRPLDGRPLSARKFLPVERPAPAITDRRPVDKPLQTGILAIDSMIPIGCGQRELIIGDRQTGKTTIAVDTILQQKNTDVYCIYCAIGQKVSSIIGIIESLKQNGAMDYTTVVAATASDSPAIQYLAPYAACAMAEGFMAEGRDVLVVYDDLSKHAVAYRTMSLLLHRPPGREAFPGDVFYLHSRLLERSACMSKEHGGGSITALPIIETMGGNISSFIPTNVISITDGQIFLEDDLFHSGIRPAVNTGLSVSRVGRAAQSPAMKKVSGSLRIELSQYREMAVFSRFGSDVDEATAKMLHRGECLTNLFKQGKGSPYSLFEEVVLLCAYKHGHLDAFEAQDISHVAENLLSFVHQNCTTAETRILSSGKLSEDDEKQLIESIRSFVEEACQDE